MNLQQILDDSPIVIELIQCFDNVMEEAGNYDYPANKDQYEYNKSIQSIFTKALKHHNDRVKTSLARVTFNKAANVEAAINIAEPYAKAFINNDITFDWSNCGLDMVNLCKVLGKVK